MNVFLAKFTSAEGIENFNPSKKTGKYPVIGKLIAGTASTLVMPRSIFDSEERVVGATYLCTEETVSVEGENYTNIIIVDKAGSDVVSLMKELGAPVNLTKDSKKKKSEKVDNPFEA